MVTLGGAALAATTAMDVVPAWRGAGLVPLGARLGLLVAGVGLVVAGLATVNGRGPARRAWTGAETAAVAAVTALALGLRVWHLDALRILVDEGNSIDNVFHARAAAPALLLPPSQYVTTLLYPYWQSLMIGLAGPTLTGLRLPSAIIGALTVPALYGLVRALQDHRRALLAAALLAVFPPHLHFSRVGLPHVLDALFGTLALACLARGWRDDRGVDWALAGASLGLTHYGFEAGRFFFTPLVLAWTAMTVVLAPDRFRDRRAGLAAMAGAFTAAVTPPYAAGLLTGADLAPRWRASHLDLGAVFGSADGMRDLLARLSGAVRVYVIRPEEAEYYGGDHALVLPVLVPLFVLGVVVAAWRPRSGAWLVTLWLAAAWLGNAALRDSAVYARWVIAMPGVAAAVALGVAAAADRLGRWAAAATLGAALVLGAIQVHYYFAVHIDRLSEQARAAKPYRDATDAVLRAVDELPAGTALVFVSDPVIDVHPPVALLRLLLGGSEAAHLEAYETADFEPEDLTAIGPDRDLAVLVAPGDAHTMTRLRSCLNLEGPRRSRFGIAPEREFVLYFAAADARHPPCRD